MGGVSTGIWISTSTGGTDTGGISTALTGGGGGGGSSGFTSLMISALMGSVIDATNLVANPLATAHSSNAWNRNSRRMNVPRRESQLPSVCVYTPILVS